jgi:hypothetical protein
MGESAAPSSARSFHSLALFAAVAALIVPAAAARTSLGGQPVLREVSYRGYSFEVPGSWPVIRLAGRPRDCVRFDRHAVYLGTPGRNEACPSRLVGTTEAIVIQPAAARSPQSSTENPVSRRITVTGPRIRVTATFDTDPTQIYQILASAFLPAPIIKPPEPAAAVTARPGPLRSLPLAAQAGQARVTAPALPEQVANFHGLGFDTCTAPSAAFMRAWKSQSRYRAVGIYIGGSDEACDQPNLTAAWLRREAAAGWHFLPMYVGPQASFHELSSTPGRQGSAAAKDAVAQAERLGFGQGTPIYYDMEAYPPAQTGAALRFESAWTTAIEAYGYSSGIYSSSASGIADLARQYSSHKYAMPDVIYDALWNGKQNTKDSVFQAGDWPTHQRVHQFAGNVSQTFGGDTMNIDQDFMNVALAVPGGTSQASPAVIQSNGVVDVFYTGPEGKLWYVRYAPRSGGWASPVALAGSADSAPTAVISHPGTLNVFYKGPGGNLWQVARKSNGRWAAPRRLAMMGGIRAPSAVAQASGVIDIFWKGSADRHLWHGQFTPGRGWSGPQRLGGSLASSPSPVASSPGTVQVFWKGTDRRLWYVVRHLAGTWSKPVLLRMGALGGPPQATAASSGATEVFWKGSKNHVWAASFASGRWRGPRSLGGQVSGAPSPATEPAGPVRVFFRGQDGKLWQITAAAHGGWHAPVRQHLGTIGAAPFVAVGDHTDPLGVFWKGPSSRLWSASLRGSTWTKPRLVGGTLR